MNIKARIIENNHNIGGGFWKVGDVIDVVGETKCFYILRNKHRVNKKHLSIAGTACEHGVKVEIFNEVA